jgi:hypothetical protein
MIKKKIKLILLAIGALIVIYFIYYKKEHTIYMNPKLFDSKRFTVSSYNYREDFSFIISNPEEVQRLKDIIEEGEFRGPTERWKSLYPLMIVFDNGTVIQMLSHGDYGYVIKDVDSAYKGTHMKLPDGINEYISGLIEERGVKMK